MKLWYGTEPTQVPPKLTSWVDQPERWVAIQVAFTVAVQTQLASPFALRPTFNWGPGSGYTQFTGALTCEMKLSFNLNPGYVTTWNGFVLVKSITPHNPTGKIDGTITMNVVHDSRYDDITAVGGSTVCGGSRDTNTRSDLVVPLTGTCS